MREGALHAHLRIGRLVLFMLGVDPEQGGCEHQPRLLDARGRILHHLYAPGGAAADCVVAWAQKQDLRVQQREAISALCMRARMHPLLSSQEVAANTAR